jgi:hypothetical protein
MRKKRAGRGALLGRFSMSLTPTIFRFRSRWQRFPRHGLASLPRLGPRVGLPVLRAGISSHSDDKKLAHNVGRVTSNPSCYRPIIIGAWSRFGSPGVMITRTVRMPVAVCRCSGIAILSARQVPSSMRRVARAPEPQPLADRAPPYAFSQKWHKTFAQYASPGRSSWR